MPKLISILASALLLAYLVTEANTRFLAGDYFIQLVVMALAFLLHGYFISRVVSTSASPGSQPSRQQNRTGGDDRSRNNARGDKRGRQEGGQRKDANPRRDGGQRNERSNERSNEGGNERGGERNSNAREDTRERDAKPAAPVTPVEGSEEGEVKWFNRSKGYGFIIRANGDEIFVHQRSILGNSNDGRRASLRDGQKVAFVVTTNEKGVQAEQVAPLD